MNNNEMQPMEIPYKKDGDYYLPMFSYPRSRSSDRPLGPDAPRLLRFFAKL